MPKVPKIVVTFDHFMRVRLVSYCRPNYYKKMEHLNFTHFRHFPIFHYC